MHSFAFAQAFVMVSLGLGKPDAADGNRPCRTFAVIRACGPAKPPEGAQQQASDMYACTWICTGCDADRSKSAPPHA